MSGLIDSTDRTLSSPPPPDLHLPLVTVIEGASDSPYSLSPYHDSNGSVIGLLVGDQKPALRYYDFLTRMEQCVALWVCGFVVRSVVCMW